MGWWRATIIVIAGGLVGCDEGTPAVGHTAPTAAFRVVDLGPAFLAFWRRARDEPFERQVELWDEHVERPHQRVFDDLVWRKKRDAAWRETRTTSLRQYFAHYREHFERIASGFEAFDGELRAQLARYREAFPDARFDLPVYALPTAGRLNGGAGTVGGEDVLAFGIDTIVVRGDPADILYAHELFHVYHVARIGTANWGTEARLTLPLWLEGLATHVSARLCPGRDDADYLMDARLGAVTIEERATLARRFLLDAGKLAWSPSSGAAYPTWFLPFGDRPLAEQPERSGYYLGLHVVRALARDHTLDELAGWQPAEIHEQALAVLRGFSAGG